MINFPEGVEDPNKILVEVDNQYLDYLKSTGNRVQTEVKEDGSYDKEYFWSSDVFMVEDGKTYLIPAHKLPKDIYLDTMYPHSDYLEDVLRLINKRRNG
jgi:hypothetical protein